MVEAPPDEALRAELDALSDEALRTRLVALHPAQHNLSDLMNRPRTIRAIEIAEYARRCPAPPAPELRPVVLGIAWPRALLRDRIATRLRVRMNSGLIEEVELLHGAGYSWARLELLGLEYRYIAQYLQGEIRNRNDLFQKLNSAIAQFAKRQETWFRRMERRGTVIHWIPKGKWEDAWEAARILADEGQECSAS
jgi:tRNA dimethylallyltransferase